MGVAPLVPDRMPCVFAIIELSIWGSQYCRHRVRHWGRRASASIAVPRLRPVSEMSGRSFGHCVKGAECTISALGRRFHLKAEIACGG